MQSGVMTPPGAKTIARVTTFSSFRTLPGQLCVMIRSSVSSRIVTGFSERLRKRCTTKGYLLDAVEEEGVHRNDIETTVKILAKAPCYRSLIEILPFRIHP